MRGIIMCERSRTWQFAFLMLATLGSLNGSQASGSDHSKYLSNPGGFEVFVEPPELSALPDLSTLPQRRVVQILLADYRKVQEFRSNLARSGQYGQVSVLHHTDSSALPFSESTVNILVCFASKPEEIESEVLRVLTPGGHCLVPRKVEFASKSWMEAHPQTVNYGQRSWTVYRKTRPAEIADWTHYLYDASNSCVSDDTVVDAPFHLRWKAGPLWSRAHEVMASTSAMVSEGGRVYTIVDEGPAASTLLPADWQLTARDAFNGSLLWKKPIGEWQTHYWPWKSGPAHMPRKLVAVGGKVYLPSSIRGPVIELDGATGQRLRTFEPTAAADELIIRGKTLLTLSNNSPPDPVEVEEYRKRRRWWMYDGLHRAYLDHDGGCRIVATCLDTGKTQWEAPFEQVSPLTLTATSDRVLLHDGKRIHCLTLADGSPVWESDELTVERRLVAENAPTLTVHENVVLFAWNGTLFSFDLATGKQLWQKGEFSQGDYRSPASVLVLDGLVWDMNITSKREDGRLTGFGPRTGEEKRTFAPGGPFRGMAHHRCYRCRATKKYVIASRSGVELVDPVKEEWREHFFVRGACLYGVMPANGMIYSTPHPCACYIKSKLNGFCALGPRRSVNGEERSGKGDDRLFHGPAFAASSLHPSAFRLHPSNVWPTFRGDCQRTGSVDRVVSVPTHLGWQSEDLGAAVTQATTGDGMIFICDKDTYTVFALNAGTGDLVWSYQAGGRVDSPPTWHAGRIYFGSADGFVYCLSASDGQLVWRLRAAPEPRQIGAFDRLESVWPVHGSVLIQTNPETGKAELFCAAGRSSFLDGGIHLLRIDPDSGSILAEEAVYHRDPKTGAELAVAANFEQDGCLNDILSGDGQSIYLRHARFSSSNLQRIESDSHLYSTLGFLDYTWWHRGYWLYSHDSRAGYAGWWQQSHQSPAGRLLVMNDDRVFGFGRTYIPGHNSAEFSRGERYHLFASPRLQKSELVQPDFSSSQRLRGQGKDHLIDWSKYSTVPRHWSQRLPMHVRAMVLTANKFFVAGPLGEGIISPDAYDGRLGSALVAIEPESGEVLQSIRLTFLPAFDGMSVDGECLLLVGTDGVLRRFGPSGTMALESLQIGEPIDFKEDFEPWPERMVGPGSARGTEQSTSRTPAGVKPLSLQKTPFSKLDGGKLYHAASGFTLVSNGGEEACLLRKLPKPLTGKITLSVSLQIASAWGRTHQNGFLVFGDGEEDEDLIKCGPQFVVSALGTADGQPVKQSRKEPITIEFKPDTAYKLTVVYDTGTGKYTASIGNWKTEGIWTLRPGGITHVGVCSFGAATTFTDFTCSAD